MPQSTDNGFIGDVRYSILEPGIFLTEHPGWELLAGQELNQDSVLAQLGYTKLPDARGMFVRAMNVGRSDNYADPDGQKRDLVTPQPQMVGSHSHLYHYPGYHTSDRLEGGGNYPRVMLEERNMQKTGIDESTGVETRPNNIALYLYIKIK